MSKNREETIRQIYFVVISVFIIAMGIATICVVADIYYSWQGTGAIFTQQKVAQSLQKLAIPLIILVGMIVGGVVFPLRNLVAKPDIENKLRIVSSKRYIANDQKEYGNAMAKYNKLSKIKMIVWIVTLAILVVCIVAQLYYLLNTANFLGTDISAEMLAMTKNILPWITISLVSQIVCSIVSAIISRQQLGQLKIVIKNSDGIIETTQDDKTKIEKIKNIFDSTLFLNIFRAIVLILSVVFVVIGITNGGARDVLVKAINICSECIGLG